MERASSALRCWMPGPGPLDPLDLGGQRSAHQVDVRGRARWISVGPVLDDLEVEVAGGDLAGLGHQPVDRVAAPSGAARGHSTSAGDEQDRGAERDRAPDVG